jgi:hypothetical protein
MSDSVTLRLNAIRKRNPIQYAIKAVIFSHSMPEKAESHIRWGSAFFAGTVEEG